VDHREFPVEMIEEEEFPSGQRVAAIPSSRSAEAAFPRAVVNWFADQVARQVSGQLLRQSQRLSLLKTAERLGIDRFHANLIIAVAQHDAQTQAARQALMVPSKHFPIAIAAIVLFMQTLIAWGAWRLLH
jgi:hypothetical protein